MKKRILSILLALCMVLCLIPTAVFAEGGTASADITGTGTEKDPYLIYTAAGLKTFRDITNGANGHTRNDDADAKLMNDIVLNDGTFDENGNRSESGTPEEWAPIGDLSNYYAGTFDGGGHTIKGLYVKGAGYAGLFGYTNGATIKNVTVDGYVEGTLHVGGIVGYGNRTTVTGCTNAATVKGGCSYVGGIVGWLYYNNGNVRNCANLGSVRAQIDSDREDARVGGIVGYVKLSKTIADCYNAGSIAIQDNGTGKKYNVSYFGGIIGRNEVMDYPCYISNCYSVGSLTYRGSASAEIYGIAGDATGCVISHCYWLEGTAESGVGDNPYQTTDLTTHTKAEFADGTVLKLLKGDRTDSPWAKCGYLSAAGMTMPVFKGQGDSHTHSEKTGNCLDGIYCECGYLMHRATSEHNWDAWTSNGNDTHSHKCQNPGCTASETDNCSGGTTTCTEQATCEICGEKYGDLKPHSYSPDWRADEINHWHECTECGAKTDEAEHKDTDKNHKCDVCEKILSKCADTNNDHKCDLCGKVLSEHTGSTATCTSKAKCEICDKEYGNVDLQNHVKLQHIDAKAATYEENGNIEYWHCPDCNKYFSNVKATDEISQMQTVISRLAKTDFTPSETTPEVETTEKEETTKSTKQSKTVKTNKSKTSPQTGNDFELLFALLIGLSSATVAVVTVDKKRKKRNIK